MMSRDRDDSSIPARGSAEERAYFEWLAGLPCIVTGQQPVQVAHVRGADAAWHKRLPGTGRKPAIPYVVPLVPAAHREQEAGNWAFWERHGFSLDPAQDSVLWLCWALWRLYGALGPSQAALAATALIRHRQRERTPPSPEEGETP